MKLGDLLQLWEGCRGVVVCSIEDNQYSAKYTQRNWSYLNKGVLIESDKAGLVYYTEPEDGFILISRCQVESNK